MEILNTTDQDDGSCIMDCSFTEQEVNFFLNYGVNSILKEEINRHENSWEHIKNIIREIVPH